MNYCLKIDVKFRDHLKKLKGANISVFMAIALHMDAEKRSFPCVSRISSLTGYDKKTVIKSIRTLERLCLIDRRKRYHKSTIYTIKGFIYPLCEREVSLPSFEGQNGELPLSKNQSEVTSREVPPTEEDTSFHKKTTTTEIIALVKKSAFFSEIDQDKLNRLINDYGLVNVLDTVVMLDSQYKQSKRGIREPQALIETALRERYKPSKYRILKGEQEALRQREFIKNKLTDGERAKEKAKMILVEQTFKALSENEYNTLREKALRELPGELRTWEPLIRAKMRELLDIHITLC